MGALNLVSPSLRVPTAGFTRTLCARHRVEPRGSRVRAFWYGLLALPATLTPCSGAGAPPPLPSEEALREQMMQMMGKSATAEPTSSDAIEVVIQTGHATSVTAVALSPDGRSVVSGGMDEAVKLWERRERAGSAQFRRSGVWLAGCRGLQPGRRALLALGGLSFRCSFEHPEEALQTLVAL
ncbi:MAG TPA: WD40 repeat domain-containing protein [Steroidobacteraceae bacterium]